jgi:hypothetical protein
VWVNVRVRVDQRNAANLGIQVLGQRIVHHGWAPDKL